MSLLDRIPKLEVCCGCVTDLKTAAAIIAVLGIVTSPAVSWAIVRHAYVIKVTCALTAKSSSPDVVDINLNNGLSFGFGGNSGMGFGCLAKSKNNTLREGEKPEKDESTESFILFIKYTGWIVLIADVVFLVSSVHLLTRLFQGSDLNATYIFLVAGLVSVLLTFLYGMTYVCLCVFVSGNFPVLEFLFAIVDLLLWMHLLVVMNSYYQSLGHIPENRIVQKMVLLVLGFLTIYGFLTNYGLLRRRTA